MATEQASSVTTETGSYAKYLAWLGALVGLWVLASPFVLSGTIAEGAPMFSNVIAGVVVLVFGAYAGYWDRTEG